MLDSYGREISYLRMSVTELCNLRCRSLRRCPPTEVWRGFTGCPARRAASA